MENKTAEEILRENGVTVDGENITQGYYNAVVYAMKLFTDQQVDKAIDKALGIVINKIKMDFVISCGSPFCEIYYVKVPEQSILSLKPEILKELEK